MNIGKSISQTIGIDLSPSRRVIAQYVFDNVIANVRANIRISIYSIDDSIESSTWLSVFLYVRKFNRLWI